MFLFLERKTVSIFPSKHVPCSRIGRLLFEPRTAAAICGARLAYAEVPASIDAAGRAKFESTELCSVYVDLHAIPALAIGNGS